LYKLEDFKKRMGWSFKWLSAGENGFNYDYYVSFKPEEIATGEIYHNYRLVKQGLAEHAGMSAFYKNPCGELFHTYSCYACGLGHIQWDQSLARSDAEEAR
jgi:predicted dithiol-disulfide oxidoreductase (DUF899 family)